jgi:hypothetical protein
MRNAQVAATSARGAAGILAGSLVSAAIALVLLAACDLGSMSQPSVPAECAKIGAQCQLPNGPLGVCQEAPCPPGSSPPCFKCTPQH